MISRYYQSELAYLRELGREFGLRNPGLADALTERGADPDVERLLEGFAFLSARIHERADAAVPELLEPLAELMAPHTLRTIPACTMLELSPKHTSLRARQEVKRGTLFGSRPVDNVICTFQTTDDIDLVPIWLDGTKVDTTRSDTPALIMQCKTSAQGLAAVYAPGPVRFFISGSHALASTILLWCARYLESVAVRPGPKSPEICELGKRMLRVPLIDSRMPDLWPWPELAPLSPRLMAEYFVFPEKHMMIELSGLERVPESMRGERFEIVLRFRRPPPLGEALPNDVFRTHCAPAINLFATSAEPVRREALRSEYLLRAAGLGPHHAEIHSVQKVIGNRARRNGRIDYRPLNAFEHRESRSEFFELLRRKSPLDGALDTYLRLSATEDALNDGGIEETVSIDMMCTNRLLPTALRPGDVGASLPGSPGGISARNITRVSPPIPAPLGTQLQWRLLGELALSHRSLAEPVALRALLALHDVPAEVDANIHRSNSLRIDALRGVRSKPASRPHGGAVIRGIDTTVELEEGRFAGPGDWFLFGCALDRLLASEIPLNAFHALRLILKPSSTEMIWPPRTGTRPLL